MLTIDEANQCIRDAILSDRGFMVSRVGAVELECHLAFSSEKFYNPIKSMYKKNRSMKYGINNAGIFPKNKRIFMNYSNMLVKDAQNVDLLGSWLDRENILFKKLPQKTALNNLEPYYHSSPWSKQLIGKTVLVVHPFSSSIISQFSKRDTLFENKEILPNFTLKTYRSIQSIGGNDNYNDWFKALDKMKNDINQIKFDVALIGCGAYGLHLASHIKAMNKVAIHLGGSIQILFGIKGKRWDNHDFISKLYNDSWIYPSEFEKPENFSQVENGCYW